MKTNKNKNSPRGSTLSETAIPRMMRSGSHSSRHTFSRGPIVHPALRRALALQYISESASIWPGMSGRSIDDAIPSPQSNEPPSVANAAARRQSPATVIPVERRCAWRAFHTPRSSAPIAVPTRCTNARRFRAAITSSCAKLKACEACRKSRRKEAWRL